MKKFFKQYTFIKTINYNFLFIYWNYFSFSSTSGTAYAIQPLLDDIFINKDENVYMMPFIIIALYCKRFWKIYSSLLYILYWSRYYKNCKR